jgi:methylisocitrate lyase
MQSRQELYDTIRYADYEALDGSIARSVVPDAADPARPRRA